MYHCKMNIKEKEGEKYGQTCKEPLRHAIRKQEATTYVFVQKRLVLLLLPRHRGCVDFRIKVDVMHDAGFGPKHLYRDHLRHVRISYLDHRLKRYRHRDLGHKGGGGTEQGSRNEER